jgi:beta-glucanase (GH16 family)
MFRRHTQANPLTAVPRGRRPRIVHVLAVVAVTMTAPIVAINALAAVPPPPAGWTLVWGDDFTGAANTGVNTGNWLYSLGHGYPGGAANWGTGEVETMTNSVSNVRQDGAGRLVITPVRDSAGNWTSGRIETQRTDFAAPAGGKLRVEASLQQPNISGAGAAGYWPAFWMMGADARPVGATNWPSIGEIDIMEDINGRSSLFTTLHCGNTASGGPCNETTGIGSGERACPGCQTGFHTYAMEYDRSVSPEQIRWYLDGTNFFTVNSTQVDATTWNNATHHGFFIILNVAMGGGFPAAFGGGPTSATVSGVPMLVDYVAVYTSTGTPTTPPVTTTPPGGISATSTVQAESFSAQSGVRTEACTDTGGGQNLASLANGDWAQYNNVNFGATPLTQFRGRVASGAAGGVSGLVEVRLDNVNNAPIGSFAVGNTGGWQSWTTVPANINGVTGTHTLFLRFTSGQPADFVNLNWFTFSA